ncbi:MAG: zinc dependent phospholipase C family protein [Desulfuromonadales bacterium]|nr:zinc dependent phospholipase C family protein [Desulfuromonadales bacterium]
MKWLISSTLASVLVLLLFPSDALAWGIGVHLQTGAWILDNLAKLPDPIRILLSAHPNDYLYGCISADITLGKKYTHYLRHCHSWRMGRKILKHATTESQQACAYGYLSHLAADTIAHSYFVPFKLVRTYNTVLLKHTYWEMRFEAHVSPETWPLARSIGRKDFSENDKLLRSILADTIFSFATNKRLFNSLLLLNRLQQYQKVLRSLAKTSKWPITPEDQEEYLGLTNKATLSLLQDVDNSPFRNADPTGERAINTANMIRKNLHTLWLDGKLRESDADQMLAVIKTRLKEGICQPDDLLTLLSES